MVRCNRIIRSFSIRILDRLDRFRLSNLITCITGCIAGCIIRMTNEAM